MHILEAYSANTRLKINKPFILEYFFPLSFDKYITIQTNGGMPAKDYSYFNEVTNILKSTLDKENIVILQLGSKNDKPINGCFNLINQTSINQSAYLIKNSLLHLGIDSILIHISSGFNKKIVGLYSVSPPSICGPYWGDKENQILLEPKFNNRKYAFDPNEYPKPVDSIKPEIIAQSVLKLLNFPYSYPYKSLFFGGLFNQQVLEGIPNQTVDLKPLGVDSNFVMRMDILFNEEFLFKQLQLSKCLIYTDRPINKDLIRAAKPQIQEVIYELNEHNSWPDYIEFLQELGVKFTLLSYCSDEIINKLKLDYFDYGIIHKRDQNPPKEIEGIDKEKIYYKTNRYILSNQKIYTSLAALKENRPVSNFGNNIEKIPNDSEFWKEKDFIYLLEK